MIFSKYHQYSQLRFFPSDSFKIFHLFPTKIFQIDIVKNIPNNTDWSQHSQHQNFPNQKFKIFQIKVFQDFVQQIWATKFSQIRNSKFSHIKFSQVKFSQLSTSFPKMVLFMSSQRLPNKGFPKYKFKNFANVPNKLPTGTF